jgi:hypothetical protein
MVKLLRCIGDVTQSKTEIRARFDDPLIIEANSKIALLNCKAQFPKLAVEGEIQIQAGDTVTVDGTIVTIPPNIYGLASFNNTLQDLIALNCGVLVQGADPLAQTIGRDYRVIVGKQPNNVFELSALACPPALARLDTEWFNVVGDEPTVTDAGTYQSNSGDISFRQSFYKAPNAAFRISATIDAISSPTSTDDNSFMIGVFGPDETLFSIGVARQDDGITTHRYAFRFNGNTDNFFPQTGITINPTVGDIITIERSQTQVEFIVSRPSLAPADTTLLAAVRDLTVEDMAIYRQSPSPFGFIECQDPLLELSNIRATLTETDVDAVLRTVPTTLTLSLGSLTLANYLGFATAGPFTGRGDPAVITSPAPINPDFQTAGILITIDPLVLDSYDGDTRTIITDRGGKKGRDSILAVLNSTENFGRNINIDVNFPVALDIKNARDYNLNQLSLRFKDQSNGQVLEFAKNAVATLVIYGPNESP